MHLNIRYKTAIVGSFFNMQRKSGSGRVCLHDVWKCPSYIEHVAE